MSYVVNAAVMDSVADVLLATAPRFSFSSAPNCSQLPVLLAITPEMRLSKMTIKLLLEAQVEMAPTPCRSRCEALEGPANASSLPPSGLPNASAPRDSRTCLPLDTLCISLLPRTWLRAHYDACDAWDQSARPQFSSLR